MKVGRSRRWSHLSKVRANDARAQDSGHGENVDREGPRNGLDGFGTCVRVYKSKCHDCEVNVSVVSLSSPNQVELTSDHPEHARISAPPASPAPSLEVNRSIHYCGICNAMLAK